MARDPKHSELVADIADDLPMGIWVARSPSGEFVYANHAFNEIMGMAARADVAAGGYAEPYGIFTRDGRPYPETKMPFVRALVERRTVEVDDIAIHRGDGRRVPVRALAKPMFDAQGELRFISIAFVDVSTEVEAERAREVAQSRLNQVVENTSVILFGFDAQGVITLSEGRGLASLGVLPGQLVGQSVFKLYAHAPEVIDATRRALDGEELHIRTRAGAVIFENYFAPVRDPLTGAVTGVSGVTTDITEREELQAKLVQADRMASLGTIGASVAHEINTPLLYVAASLRHLSTQLPQLAGAHSGVLGPLMQLLDEARHGVERVQTIARDLNTFSAPGEQRSPVELHAVLEIALRMTSNQTRHKARVELALDPVAPVLANEARLAQVFVNLLINAAQALPDGAPAQSEIRVVSRHEGSQVVVEVSDNGPGIAEPLRARVFEPFFTTKPAGQGTGLGLSICRTIVRELGGEISVHPNTPHGATFRVALPAAPAGTALVMSSGPGEPPPVSGAGSLQDPNGGPGSPLEGRPRVLIVDDNPALGRVLRKTLAPLCELEMIDSGRAAVDRLLEGPAFDVVLCDLMMPEFTGMDVYEAVRARRPGLERTLCFMTGGAFTARAREFLASIENRCFQKPFDFAEVIAEVLRERQAAKP